MPSIAYIDHSYHQKTLSTAFVPQLLRQHGQDVTCYWDDSWRGGKGVALGDLPRHDAIVLFQNLPRFLGRLGRKHPNITFIPMLDSYCTSFSRGANWSRYWPAFRGVKILNFSLALHHVANSAGLYSRHFQFFQPPAPPRTRSGLHGFFWCRRPDMVSFAHIRQLLGETRFDSFHLHLATDPGAHTPPMPTDEEMRRHGITTSTWFEDKAEYEATLDRANVFFAPRSEEGIGQATLEAMARGQCVVAPDGATMNEYITHGVNGLLYDRTRPRALDFSAVSAMGDRARESVSIGHARWQAAIPEMVEYILTPAAACYKGLYRPADPAPGTLLRAVTTLPFMWRMTTRLRPLIKRLLRVREF